MGLTAEEKIPRLLERPFKGLDLNRINRLACLGLPRRVPCNDHAGGSVSSENTESKKDSSLIKEDHILQVSQGLVAAGNSIFPAVDSTEARKRKADRNAGCFHGDTPAKQATGRSCPSTRSSLDLSTDQIHKKAINVAKELLEDKENINVCYDHCKREPRKQGSERNVEKRRLQVSTRLQNGASDRKIGSLLVKKYAKPRVYACDIVVPQASLLSHINTSIQENAQQVLTNESMEGSQEKSRMSCWQDAQQYSTDIEVGASAVMSIPPVTACLTTIRATSAPLLTLYTDENIQASELQGKNSPEKNDSGLAHGPVKQPQQSSTSLVLKKQASVAVKAALAENGDLKAGRERASQDALSMSDAGAGKLIQHLDMPEKKGIDAGNASVQTKKQGENEQFVWVNGKRYQKLMKIGRGGSSEVYKVIDRDGDIYALKRIKLKGRDYGTASGFYQEIELLTRLQGKRYIIRLIDHEVTDKLLFSNEKEGSHIIRHDANIYMLLEYGEVDLATMLQDNLKERSQGQNEVNEDWLRFYWRQIVEAVSTVHEERILHADLKPANFLLVQGVLKLIDFGIAKSIQNDTTHIERDAQVGTLNYMSPEAFLMNEKDEHGNVIKCNRSSDIWALGCILYQMVYGKTPFAHITALHAKIQEVANPNHKIVYLPVSNPDLLDIMKKCLAYKREDRLRIPELMNHPFLQPHLAQPMYSKKVEQEIHLQIQEENKQGREAAALTKLLERVSLLEKASIVTD